MWQKIKLEIYNSERDWNDGIPNSVVSLKELEDMLNDGDCLIEMCYHFKFVEVEELEDVAED